MGFLSSIIRYSVRKHFYRKAFSSVRGGSKEKFCPKITYSPKTIKPNPDLTLEKEMFDQLDRGVGRKR